jgi:hypothetical protein
MYPERMTALVSEGLIFTSEVCEVWGAKVEIHNCRFWQDHFELCSEIWGTIAIYS